MGNSRSTGGVIKEEDALDGVVPTVAKVPKVKRRVGFINRLSKPHKSEEKTARDFEIESEGKSALLAATAASTEKRKRKLFSNTADKIPENQPTPQIKSSIAPPRISVVEKLDLEIPRNFDGFSQFSIESKQTPGISLNGKAKFGGEGSTPSVKVVKNEGKKKVRPKVGRQRSSTLGSLPKPFLNSNELFSVKLKKTEAPKTETKINLTSSGEKKKLNFTSSTTLSEIFPYLFVSGDMAAKNKPLLLQHQVKHVINAAAAVCKDYFPEELNYLTFNLLDSTKEGGLLPFLLESISFIEKARGDGENVFVHCHQGVSRSCTIVVAYVMWRDRCEFQKAFDLVKGKHSVCGPNANFICQLIEWEEMLKSEIDVPQLYRIAPHSKRYPKLLIKLCITENRKPAKPKIDLLDKRGTFLLFDPKPRRFYIWQCNTIQQSSDVEGGGGEGDRVVFNGAQCLERAEHFAELMRDLLPCFKDCTIIRVISNTVEEERFLGLLGTKDRSSIPSSNTLYDIEYDNTPTTKTKPKKPPLEKTIKNSPTSKNNNNSTTLINKNKKEIKNSLYLWDSAKDVFILLKDYDGDDLGNKNCIVLISVQDDVVFCWMGEDMEEIISEEKAQDKVKTFLKGKGQNFDLRLEHGGSESEAFWKAFEAGF